MPQTIPKHIKSYNGNVYKNLLSARTGFLLWYQNKKWWKDNAPGRRWRTTLCSTSVGSDGSPAERLYKFIEEGGLKTYTKEYRFIIGPNSNTFTQWVVDQVPECKLRLPWNAWGKGCSVDN